MLEFVTHKRINGETAEPTWLVIYCRQVPGVNELGFVKVMLVDTYIIAGFSTTLITDEDEQVEFNFEVAQYLVKHGEIIMGEDGDYYLPE